MDVCDYFNLHPTSTHMAVAFLDRMQPNEKFTRFEWQMVAICCIVISAKYNECETHVPDLSTIEEITHQQISYTMLLNYELWVLKRMGWKLHARTCMHFLSNYITIGITHRDDKYYVPYTKQIMDIPVSIHEYMSIMIYTLSNYTLLDLLFKEYVSSDLAAAIIYITRRNLNITPIWNSSLALMTGVGNVECLSTIITSLHEYATPHLIKYFGTDVFNNSNTTTTTSTIPTNANITVNYIPMDIMNEIQIYLELKNKLYVHSLLKEEEEVEIDSDVELGSSNTLGNKSSEDVFVTANSSILPETDNTSVIFFSPNKTIQDANGHTVTNDTVFMTPQLSIQMKDLQLNETPVVLAQSGDSIMNNNKVTQISPVSIANGIVDGVY